MTAKSKKGKELEELSKEYGELKSSIESQLDSEEFYQNNTETAVKAFHKLCKESEKIVERYLTTKARLEEYGITLNDRLYERMLEIDRHIKLQETLESVDRQLNKIQKMHARRAFTKKVWLYRW